MNVNTSKNYPIDAIITWVDGGDPKIQKKINQYSEEKIDWSNKKETVRFNSINEIEIAIKSIIKHASFVKNIYLVTDNQSPIGFNELKSLALNSNINLILVDHTDIFKGYEQFLPTFNARSISAMLYRIPNLSEHFIIFNDDTFLMKPTSREDFFNNGTPIIRGIWGKFYEHQKVRVLAKKIMKSLNFKQKHNPTGYKQAQQTSAKILGFKKYIIGHHTPDSFRKSILEDFFNKNKDTLENTISHKFRNLDQFFIQSISNHLEAKKTTSNIKNDYQLTYFQSYKYLLLIKLKLYMFSNSRSKIFMCFQNLELAKQKEQDYIVNWMNKQLNT